MPTRPVLSLSSPLDANRDFAGVLELYSSEPVILPLAACCASGYCAPVPVHRKRRLRRRDIRRTSVGWHRCSEARHARRADRRYTGKQSGPLLFEGPPRIAAPFFSPAWGFSPVRALARNVDLALFRLIVSNRRSRSWTLDALPRRSFRRFNIRLRSTVALVDWTAR